MNTVNQNNQPPMPPALRIVQIILVALLCLVLLKRSSAQKLYRPGASSITLTEKQLDSLRSKPGTVLYGSMDGYEAIHFAPKNDTIPTIMLCADTSNIVSLTVYSNSNWSLLFEGLTTPAGGSATTTTFTVIGYRVAGNVRYCINAGKHLIEGQQYLDDRKRLLPKNFIVFSFVDRKSQ